MTEFPVSLQDRTPLTCPCILGDDGLALDVTGTQLVEKDIENLARGEVQSGKWNCKVLEVDGPLEERGLYSCSGCVPKHHWGRGHRFPSYPAERITLWVHGTRE